MGQIGTIKLVRWTIPLILVISSLGLVISVYVNGVSNINMMLFGKSATLYLIAAIFGTVATSAICILSPRTRLAALLSKHSLLIFCIHFYVTKAVNSLIQNNTILERQIYAVVLGILVTIMCALISVAATPYMERYILRRNNPSLSLNHR